jgi:hypothetical protein
VPNETTEVNLSRALKLKNRVVHRLALLDGLITSCNSGLDENHEYDVRELYKERTELAQRLVELKTAINAANQPVQKLIFELAEAKSLVAMLRRIETKNGPAIEGYPGTRVTYVVQWRKAEIDREARRVEQEIDRLQEQLDRINFKTLIKIDPSILADVPTGPNPLFEV